MNFTLVFIAVSVLVGVAIHIVTGRHIVRSVVIGAVIVAAMLMAVRFTVGVHDMALAVKQNAVPH